MSSAKRQGHKRRSGSIKKNNNPNRQGFYNHVGTIKGVERNKDAFFTPPG